MIAFADDFGNVMPNGEVEEFVSPGHSYADPKIAKVVLKLVKLHMRKRHSPKVKTRVKKRR